MDKVEIMQEQMNNVKVKMKILGNVQKRNARDKKTPL